MFNPAQLDFRRSIRLNQPPGSRSGQGQAKVSFANPEPCTLTLSNIMFDTYETGENVLTLYIDKLVRAVKFLNANPPRGGGGSSQSPATRHSSGTRRQAENNRPPIYLFTWNQQQYLRCFVESFQYQLTLFLPDGTPVRAKVNLTLKEVDESVGPANPRTPSRPAEPSTDSRETRRRP
ncbi:MAG TPA: hypothetical protein IGS53_00980 [Leptolyngbyaceae cyanobacterium M33_DOE_097]|nr:hypothetical protein [Leptolyngbyaceae cyanobacterium M33_DOE_097]